MIDPPLLARILALVDRLSEVSGRLFAWFIAPLILGISYEVVMRYAFNAPTIWAYDLAYMTYEGRVLHCNISPRGVLLQDLTPHPSRGV